MGQTLPSRDFCGTAALPLKPDIIWRGWHGRKSAIQRTFAPKASSEFCDAYDPHSIFRTDPWGRSASKLTCPFSHRRQRDQRPDPMSSGASKR
jgi:hypothetical protein